MEPGMGVERRVRPLKFRALCLNRTQGNNSSVVANLTLHRRQLLQKETDLTNERWLKWVVARYYRSHGYKVSMKPVRAGNAMVYGLLLALKASA
jgi:hypothetical protein